MPPDSSVEEEGNRKQKLQKWLDQNQYTRKGILRYEAIFGKTYVSVGGEITTRQFTEDLGLEPDKRVLDIGCGIGGSAFYMARKFHVHVHGVDLSTNMVAIAQDYRADMEPEVKHRVQFYVEDATSMSYPANFYHLVYSRDTILHIKDKEKLFRQLYHTLVPGGRIFITDYCMGDQELSDSFKAYVAQRAYNLHTVADYGQILSNVGFQNVVAKDMTGMMVDMMELELEKFHQIREKFIEEFSEEDFLYLTQGWSEKIVRCKAGDQAWGLFSAIK